MRILLGTLAAAAAALVATAAPFLTSPALAATGNLGSCVSSGTRLDAGAVLTSSGGGYKLVMQTDGNLVEYTVGGKPLWASETGGHPGAWAVQQTDANLVVYSATGAPLWASYPTLTSGTSQLCVQDDANVVTYSPTGRALWATMTADVPTGAITSTNAFPQGQCTWWAEQQAYYYVGRFPAFWGDARYWGGYAQSRGYHVDHIARTGSVAVFQPGVAGAGGYGHVAWVLDYYPDRNAIRISEMNYLGPGVVDTRIVYGASGNAGVAYIALNP